jgi:hypothetical protein
MVVLDGNFALGCGPGTDYSQIHTFKCMLEQTDAIMNDVLEQITFVLAYRTVFLFATVLKIALGPRLLEACPGRRTLFQASVEDSFFNRRLQSLVVIESIETSPNN